nr:AAA family ATPase [Rhodococcus sp. (in: high G+C Gram-positive bacteria)]
MEPIEVARAEALTDDKQKLLVTRGIPGSGKSSFAELWTGMSEHHARVNRDDLRKMLFNSSGVLTQDKEAAVSAAERAQVRALLKQGKSVIVDAMHLRAQYARIWAEIAKELGIRFEVVDFKVVLEDAIERDRQRGLAGERTVGEEVIRKLYKQFPQNRWPAIAARETAPGPMEPYTPHLGKPLTYIFDIDGTLAHMGDRRSPYDYTQVHLDEPDEHVVEIAKTLWESGFVILVVSGRDASCYKATEEWLTSNGIGYNKLLMRGDNDKRPDFKVKYDIFDRHIRNNYHILGVFDDRKQVIDMWRALGLKCFQVQEGNF